MLRLFTIACCPSTKKLATMKDEDIDLSDINELDDDFFQHAEVRIPPNEN